MSSLASQIASGSLSLPTLSSLHASGLLICSNVRLHHRYANAAAVQKWMSSVAVRVTSAAGQPDAHRGVEGDLVVGLLYPPMPGAAPTRIRDHTGALHSIEPRTHDPATHAPLRILAVLGTRDSSTHVCGGVFDPVAAAAASSPSASALAFSSMPLASGLKLAWLAEEGGLVGHLTSDAAPSVVLGVRSESDAQPKATGAEATAFEVLQQACAFEVMGPVVELDGRKAVNIRSLCPVMPPSPSITPSAAHAHTPAAATPVPLLAFTGTTPRVILVGSTASTLGKTRLCSLVVQSLHALSFSRGLEAPRISFVKLTGSGGSRDMAQMMQIKNARGQRGVCAAFDHVDAGLATTYTPAPQAGPQALAAQQERFKHAIQDLIALASQPCVVPPVGGALPSRRSAHSPSSAGSSPALSPASAAVVAASKPLPPDFIVVELGSDVIFASNPVVLAASAHCIRDRLLGLLLLASDTLAILGALSWLHGNLRFPPQLLHIVVDPRRNLGGMAKRISGSEIDLHAMQAADIQALMQQIVPAPSPEAVAAASGAVSDLSLPAPSLTAASFSAVASALPSVVHTTAMPSRSATSSPRTPSQAAAPPSNGSTSAASSAPSPSWPIHPTATQSSTADPVASPRTMLAADAEALAWFERSFAPWVSSFPPLVAPTSDASLSPATSMLCLSLVEWATQCTPKLGVIGSLKWQAPEVCLLVLRLSRSDRLARSLAYLSALRRRDKIRARMAKEKEEAARELLGASLGKLMAAKTGGTPSSAAAAATPSGSSASAPTAASPSLLLSLPDLSHTPYAWLSPAVPPPASAPAALLDFDAGLGVLRLATVPARVSEQPFWDCYFGCMSEELSAYLASKATSG